jgi:hypothetical protein
VRQHVYYNPEPDPHEPPRFGAELFKGVKRAGSRAIVYRSPPIAGTGPVRLFFCSNEVVDD